jgi:hypothetical protein
MDEISAIRPEWPAMPRRSKYQTPLLEKGIMQATPLADPEERHDDWRVEPDSAARAERNPTHSEKSFHPQVILPRWPDTIST